MPSGEIVHDGDARLIAIDAREKLGARRAKLGAIAALAACVLAGGLRHARGFAIRQLAATGGSPTRWTPDLRREIDGVDYGGTDRHMMEETGDIDDMDSLYGTRGTTVRFALALYFCGTEHANNLNRDQAIVSPGLVFAGGADILESFQNFIVAQRKFATPEKGHAHLVYRLGVSAETRGKPAMDHVWTVVAQPDGSYHWLQGYIQKYSLQTWMAHAERTGQRRLTAEQLLSKLDDLATLMRNKIAWTEASNRIYMELFHKALRIIAEWRPEHRLSTFTWDVAWEYPLPTESGAAPAQARSGCEVIADFAEFLNSD
ncbi:hypothetical protein T492DRAFT_1133670 [Pavlovales sp. CCMP2436]|nr:hypothetical protein T492DRAFT_1133670 [Pavlovales sp. CCMP2436]